MLRTVIEPHQANIENLQKIVAGGREEILRRMELADHTYKQNVIVMEVNMVMVRCCKGKMVEAEDIEAYFVTRNQTLITRSNTDLCYLLFVIFITAFIINQFLRDCTIKDKLYHKFVSTKLNLRTTI